MEIPFFTESAYKGNCFRSVMGDMYCYFSRVVSDSVGIKCTFQNFEIICILPPFHNVVHINFLESQTKQNLTEFTKKAIYIYNSKHI